jgi:hypothetical protein
MQQPSENHTLAYLHNMTPLRRSYAEEKVIAVI